MGSIDISTLKPPSKQIDISALRPPSSAPALPGIGDFARGAVGDIKAGVKGVMNIPELLDVFGAAMDLHGSPERRKEARDKIKGMGKAAVEEFGQVLSDWQTIRRGVTPESDSSESNVINQLEGYLPPVSPEQHAGAMGRFADNPLEYVGLPAGAATATATQGLTSKALGAFGKTRKRTPDVTPEITPKPQTPYQASWEAIDAEANKSVFKEATDEITDATDVTWVEDAYESFSEAIDPPKPAPVVTPEVKAKPAAKKKPPKTAPKPSQQTSKGKTTPAKQKAATASKPKLPWGYNKDKGFHIDIGGRRHFDYEGIKKTHKDFTLTEPEFELITYYFRKKNHLKENFEPRELVSANFLLDKILKWSKDKTK